MQIVIKELLDVSAPENDHYSVTATLQLVEDGKILAEKPVTVTGFEYEAETFRKAVKGKLMAAGRQWAEQFIKARRMAKQLEGIESEIDEQPTNID